MKFSQVYACLWDYSQYHSVTAMLDKLQWPTLKDRRQHVIAAMMHKIINNLIDIEASLYLTPTTSATIVVIQADTYHVYSG